MGRKVQMTRIKPNIMNFSGTEQTDFLFFWWFPFCDASISFLSTSDVSRVLVAHLHPESPAVWPLTPSHYQKTGKISGRWNALSETLSETSGEMQGRGRKGALVFPTMGAVECLGSAMTDGSNGGGGGFRGAERGAVRLFKGWLFALLVSWGLRSSVQQNSPSN